jgi:dTDP-4-amino-4,6-dideoxygalactose transaminase/CelD/BcsL family acetyltransferase involved in cellulose biosynthesis
LLPFPLQDGRCSLFARDRHALFHGVLALGLAPGDEVLVPAYHHGAEVEALLRANLSCRFYDASNGLEPVEDELEALCGARSRALLLTHDFGFPKDAPRWRRWCDEKGLLLLENAAQAWLASLGGLPVGSFGHLAVFGVYKTLGLPDGAALFLGGVDPDVARAGVSLAANADSLRAWRRGWFLASAALSDRAATSPRGSSREGFMLGNPDTAPSPLVQLLLPRIAEAAVAGRRRANFQLLLEELADLVPEPFADPPNGASPFVFPLEAENKEALLERLAEHGVRAAELWPTPHPSCPEESYPGAAARRRRLIGLPVHQELRVGDLERIARAVRPTRRRQPALRLEPMTTLDELRVEWNELAKASQNVFATWEWNSTWWSHFGAERALFATSCRSTAGELVAVLPLHLATTSPLRIVRFVGYGPADQLGPVCEPVQRPLVARALRRALAETPWRWDVFFGEQLWAEEGWSAFLGGKLMQRTRSPVLRFRGGWADFLALKSSHFRKRMRWQERRLEREHELRYRRAEDPARLDADLDTLFALHAARWPDGSSFAAEESFHRDFAARALERGWLRLWFLEIDGRPVAAWYGFRFSGIEWHYQTGRDPAWREASVGLLLVAHTVRQALEEGVHEYRFLRGDEPYKYRLATADPGLETIALSRGMAGELALVAAPAFRKWRPRRLEEWYHAAPAPNPGPGDER